MSGQASDLTALVARLRGGGDRERLTLELVPGRASIDVDRIAHRKLPAVRRDRLFADTSLETHLTPVSQA
jgi:hypothetical protein